MWSWIKSWFIKLTPDIKPLKPLPDSDPIWIRMASQELGITEIPGKMNNPRISEYFRSIGAGHSADEIPWCSSFVNFILKKSGYKITGSGAARSWLKYGPVIPYKKYAIVIFKRGAAWQGHVAFVMGETPDKIRVLGGNQGNKVSIAEYPKKDVLGYRWPIRIPPPPDQKLV